jgi:flagellar biosynthesis protein FlhF
MRLRSFTAPTIVEAMRQVREALGPEAIIVSTHEPGKGAPVRVTAAIETVIPELEAAPAKSDGTSNETAPDERAPKGARQDAAAPAARRDDAAGRLIRDAFEFHGVPTVLAERLGALAHDALASGAVEGDALLALAAALDIRFRFAPLAAFPARPLMLVGPPGAGKTTSLAKLAARGALAGRRLGVISTDTLRAGGVEQLGAFTRLLAFDLQVAEDAGALADAVLAAQGCEGVLIDSAGTNPYDDEALAQLAAMIAAAEAEPVLVLPAGGDALEAAEAAAAFAEIGATRLLVTRLDAARRLASLLTAAEAGKLAIAEVGTTPQIADGLAPLNPVSLARLLLGELAADSRSQAPREGRAQSRKARRQQSQSPQSLRAAS